METWFTSDSHFGHVKIIKYLNRPWWEDKSNLPTRQDVDRMNEALIKNWNAVVGVNDYVYHLGDFAVGVDNKVEYSGAIVERLNGNITLVEGNHDKTNNRKSIYKGTGVFDSVQDYLEIDVEGQYIVLFHYGMRTWHKDLRGAWHLYGHSHSGLPPYGKSFDVGVDVCGFRPTSFREVKIMMDQRQIGPHPQFEQYVEEKKTWECQVTDPKQHSMCVK